MKKLTALLLAAAMALSLVACSNNKETTITKEEMIEIATELSSETLGEIEENIAKGLEYKDNYCIIRGCVEAIHTDYCEIAPYYMSDNYEVTGPDFIILNAYLSTDELVDLEEDMQVSIIGHISDIGEESTDIDSAAGYGAEILIGTEKERKFITMDNAFVYEILGKITKLY